MIPVIISFFGLLKGVAWPAAAIFLAIKFKSEILSWLPDLRKQLPRVQEIGLTGVKFSPAGQQKTTEETPITKPDELKTTVNPVGTPAELALEVPLRADLANINEDQKIDVLVRALVQARLVAGHERIYRLIFGSQILGLRELNAAGRVTLDDARTFFERTTAAYQDFYRGYGFEGWL
ncbi:MAG: hypothetical protein ACYCOU_13470 [Sulfobacillus sp.]